MDVAIHTYTQKQQTGMKGNLYHHHPEEKAALIQKRVDEVRNRSSVIRHELISLSNNTSLTKTEEEIKHENVGSVVLQFLGLMGLTALFGRISFLCLSGLFVPSVAFFLDFLHELPDIFATALVFPYLVIVAEMVGLSFFFFGQNEYTTSYYLMSNWLHLCESTITNAWVLKFFGLLTLFASVIGIFHQNALSKRIVYD
jgi:hypothetical protein